MRTPFVLAAAVAVALANPLHAHGPQIQITGDTGKIVTRSLMLDSPYESLTSEKSAYVMPLIENFGVWCTRPNGAIISATMLPRFYSGPGIAYGYGYNPSNSTDVDFAVGSRISLTFTDGLKHWNGAAFVDAGPTELEAFRGSFVLPSATARTSDAAPFASIAYDPVNYATDGTEAHQTTRFRLLGDGVAPTTASPDGVYLAALQLTSEQRGMAPSDPFYFVLHKNADRAAIESAVAALSLAPQLVQFVPEPCSAAIYFSAVAFAATKCRHRRGPRT